MCIFLFACSNLVSSFLQWNFSNIHYFIIAYMLVYGIWCASLRIIHMYVRNARKKFKKGVEIIFCSIVLQKVRKQLRNTVYYQSLLLAFY